MFPLKLLPFLILYGSEWESHLYYTIVFHAVPKVNPNCRSHLRKVLAHTGPVARDNQSSGGLMCANQPPRQVSGQMEHPVDGLGKRIRGWISRWRPLLVKKLGDHHTSMTSVTSVLHDGLLWNPVPLYRYIPL